MLRPLTSALAILAAAALAGCNTLPTPEGDFGSSSSISSFAPSGNSFAGNAYQDPGARVMPRGTGGSPFANFTGGHDLQQGKDQFRAGNFGLAEKHYRKAVEGDPDNAEAWIGLAASYDQLGRFALADRAYARATALTGQNAVVLNNQGYSYFLRGDVTRARAKLAAAKALSPATVTIDGNLALLEENRRIASTVR